jgi:hypothetical protein
MKICFIFVLIREIDENGRWKEKQIIAKNWCWFGQTKSMVDFQMDTQPVFDYIWIGKCFDRLNDQLHPQEVWDGHILQWPLE